MTNNTTPHIAITYDKSVRDTLPYYDLLMKEVIQVSKIIKPNATYWLDTGCGTGNLIDLAIKEFTHTQFMITDPAQEMLDIAMAKNTDHTNVKALGTYTTQQLSSINITRPEVISAIQCHHYLDWESRKKALKVCFDLLPEGGLFVTSENISPFTQDGIDYSKQKSIHFQMSNGRTLEESTAHSDRFGIHYFPITVEQYLLLLRGCGFKVVEILWSSNTLAGFYCIK